MDLKERFLDIEYYDKSVDKYHLFLNEARLSALAMAVFIFQL